MPSAWLIASMRSLFSLSACAYCSAFLTMFSISSLLSPPDDWMTICCSLPVPLSRADTCTMPLASISNTTSICGTPRGAGGIPTSVNEPSILLSLAISRSPWCTLISTCV
uniref:Putative secreted protein n=1 Tax=Anopheles darlingi TaxID=43151 RepID=A0A2M4D018_ANODA